MADIEVVMALDDAEVRAKLPLLLDNIQQVNRAAANLGDGAVSKFGHELRTAALGSNLVKSSLIGVAAATAAVTRGTTEYGKVNSSVGDQLERIEKAGTKFWRTLGRESAEALPMVEKFIGMMSKAVVDWNTPLTESRGLSLGSTARAVAGFGPLDYSTELYHAGENSGEDLRRARMEQESFDVVSARAAASRAMQIEHRASMANDPVSRAYANKDKMLLDAERIIAEKYSNEPALAKQYLDNVTTQAQAAILRAHSESNRAAEKVRDEAGERRRKAEKEEQEERDRKLQAETSAAFAEIDLNRRVQESMDLVADARVSADAVMMRAGGQEQEAAVAEKRLEFEQRIRDIQRNDDLDRMTKDDLTAQLLAIRDTEIGAILSARDRDTGRVLGGTSIGNGFGGLAVQGRVFGSGGNQNPQQSVVEELKKANRTLDEIRRGGNASAYSE